MLKTVSKKFQAIFVVVVMLAASAAVVPEVFAASLTSATVMLTNMNASGSGPVIVEFTTSASNTGSSLTVGFTGYTGGAAGAVNATQTVANTLGSTNCTTITGASANLPGTPTASGNASTGLITFSGLTAMTANTSYCVVLSSATAVTNPTATGPQTAVITAGSDAATSVEVDIISNDQVVVNATVLPTFTMALSGNTDNFTSNLSSGATAATTGVTVTVNTNAKTGWYLWGSDANTGLKSATQNYTIASKTPGTNATLSNGSEGYVSGLPAAGITQGSGLGVTSATTAYASSGAGNGSGLDATPRQIASSTGTANGAIVTVKEYATIGGTTPAATDYSDTITLVGAGSF